MTTYNWVYQWYHIENEDEMNIILKDSLWYNKYEWNGGQEKVTSVL